MNVTVIPSDTLKQNFNLALWVQGLASDMNQLHVASFDQVFHADDLDEAIAAAHVVCNTGGLEFGNEALGTLSFNPQFEEMPDGILRYTSGVISLTMDYILDRMRRTGRQSVMIVASRVLAERICSHTGRIHAEKAVKELNSRGYVFFSFELPANLKLLEPKHAPACT